MISIPPPSRVALGTAIVDGKRVEIFLTAEWARYFQSINSMAVSSSQVGDNSAVGASIMFGSDAGNDSDNVLVVPGPAGASGLPGAPGPAIFMLQDPESNDIFWPVKSN